MPPVCGQGTADVYFKRRHGKSRRSGLPGSLTSAVVGDDWV